MEEECRMRWALEVGRLYGIAIRLHFTFVFLLAFVGVLSVLTRGWLGALYSLLFIILVFFCVFLHELAHCYVSVGYGLRVRSITLLPIGGLAMFEDMPREPQQETRIALAGPRPTSCWRCGSESCCWSSTQRASSGRRWPATTPPVCFLLSSGPIFTSGSSISFPPIRSMAGACCAPGWRAAWTSLTPPAAPPASVSSSRWS
jgi:membrane-associated protease RseP (regulator of RpoE activity)